MEKLKKKWKSFCWWIWQACRDRQTIALLLAVAAAVYSPVWGGLLLYRLLGWKWALAMATGCSLFWAGPGTPFFPLCMGLTLSLKKALQARKNAKQRKKNGNRSDRSC